MEDFGRLVNRLDRAGNNAHWSMLDFIHPVTSPCIVQMPQNNPLNHLQKFEKIKIIALIN